MYARWRLGRQELRERATWAYRTAHDRAIQSFKTPPTYAMRESIAAEIVIFSQAGLRDPQELCRRALQPFTFADVA